MIERSQFHNILSQCFQGKVIILLGARQTGKTTLLKQIISKANVPSVWFNADEADIFESFSQARTSTALLQVIGQNTRLAIIDEAHQIPDIGKKLKLLYDTKPELQVIATGSSAFELSNQTQEPLTGRKRTFYLHPLSYQEMAQHTSALEAKRLLNTRLIYGFYPEVVNNPGKEKQALLEIAGSYLYKDILQIDGVRKSSLLEKILQALAFQVGQEVKYHEIAHTIGNVHPTTVEKYLDLLEKTFVIYKLPALSRNMRTELKKGKKYYFFDNGIRNVLISNYSMPEMRQDIGALWENFLLSERQKANHYSFKSPNTYFWRTHDQAEIDYIEETEGVLNAYEFKWKEKNARFPESFRLHYPDHQTQTIHRGNFQSFIEY